MADITERLRAVCEKGCDPDLPYEAADEIDRLRAHVADTDGAITVLGFQNAELRARVAELEAEREAACIQSRCECDSDDACRKLAALHRRGDELAPAKGEPVAWIGAGRAGYFTEAAAALLRPQLLDQPTPDAARDRGALQAVEHGARTRGHRGLLRPVHRGTFGR